MLQDILQALIKALREGEDPTLPGNAITVDSVLRAYRHFIHVSSQSDKISMLLKLQQLSSADYYKAWEVKASDRIKCSNPHCEIAHRFVREFLAIFLARPKSKVQMRTKK